MSTFKEFLLNEYENEYVFKVKKDYSTPKIYDADGDMSKRWYVYFSFRNPETGKLERQKPVYVSLKLNKKERMHELKTYKAALIQLLETGYSPFKAHSYESNNKRVTSATQAIDFGLNIKKNTLSTSSYSKLESRVNDFKSYLKSIGFDFRDVNDINKKVVNSYLNGVLERSSAANRNNAKRDIGSVFKILESEELIQVNYFSKIPKLVSKPKRNKAYTEKEVKEIFEYLENNDPILLRYVKFVTYGFLRSVEVCRLKVGDIDFENKVMVFKAKNQPIKTKLIIDLLYKEIPDLSDCNPEDFLFTPTGVPGKWNTTEMNRRGYFGKRYSIIRKKLGYSDDYNIYSFRHSATIKVYRNLREVKTQDEAESALMMITGHKYRSSLKKYLREIDAELPDDYSNLLLN